MKPAGQNAADNVEIVPHTQNNIFIRENPIIDVIKF